MEANQPLLGGAAFLAAVLVTVVDGRNAVSIASLAAALGLTPSVVTVYGGDAGLLLIAAAVTAALAGPASRAMARRISWMAGMDPAVPVVVGARDSLFGPRSIRVATAVLVLPAASWVSFNVPLGSASPVTGVLFPAALVWGCGAVRLLAARTLSDVAVGVATIGLAAAAAWFLCAGVDTVGGAAAAAALAPGAAIAAGWLRGRSAARPGLPQP